MKENIRTVSWAPRFKYWLDEYGDYIVEDTSNGDQYLAPTEADIDALVKEILEKKYLRLGDGIAALTTLLGVHPCPACKARAKQLNRLVKIPTMLRRKLPKN